MAEVDFAPGAACGGCLTHAQVKARQHACTRRAEEGMPAADSYRRWKADVVKQSHRSARAWAAFRWTAVTVLMLTALSAAVETSQPGTAVSIRSSISNAWYARMPQASLITLSSHLPAFPFVAPTPAEESTPASTALFPEIQHSVEALSSTDPPHDNQRPAERGLTRSLLKHTDQPTSASNKLFPEIKHDMEAKSNTADAEHDQDALDCGTSLSPLKDCQKQASSALFPEIKHAVKALSNKISSHEDPANSLISRSWSLFTPAEQQSKAIPVDWHLENILLRSAELECDLAAVRDENQQLSAHLLSAARQLAAVGQTVHLAEDKQAPASTARKLFQGQNAAAMLLLSLAAGSSVVWAVTRGCRQCSSHAANQQNLAEQVQGLQQHKDKLTRQVERHQQELTQAEQTIMGLSSGKAAVEARGRASQQKIAGLQADLARAECLLDRHDVAKMKLPLFPMSPLAAPPVRHDRDKENSGRPAKAARPQASAQREAKAASQAQPERETLLDKLKGLEADKASLEGQVASLQAEQAGLQDACRKADEDRSKMQLDTEALELRVFTTHEQLAVSEEREAELAAAVREAKQTAAAAQRALAAEQATVKCLQTAAMPSEQVDVVSAARQESQCTASTDSRPHQEQYEHQHDSHTIQSAEPVGSMSCGAEAQEHPSQVSQISSQGTAPVVPTAESVHNGSDTTTSAQAAGTDDNELHSDDTTDAAGEAVTATAGDHGSIAEVCGLDEAATAGVDHNAQDPGHLPAGHLVCRVRGGEQETVGSSMQTSPIYGVATASSLAFTPTHDRLAQHARQGPKTPWSADWVTSFLTSGGKSRGSSRRASSISPTRLFEFNGDNTVPDPEDLFNCWHGKLSPMDGPRRA